MSLQIPLIHSFWFGYCNFEQPLDLTEPLSNWTLLPCIARRILYYGLGIYKAEVNNWILIKRSPNICTCNCLTHFLPFLIFLIGRLKIYCLDKLYCALLRRSYKQYSVQNSSDQCSIFYQNLLFTVFMCYRKYTCFELIYLPHI